MTLTLSPTQARRLAVANQKLAGPPPTPDKEAILSLMDRLGCLQIDPINVVARSHLLVLWSRLGSFDTAALDALLWQDKALFECWAHAASIVLTEDYPLHQAQMRHFAAGDSAWSVRIRTWLAENEPFRHYILEELGQRGPLLAEELKDRSVTPWQSSGWTHGRNVSTMLGLLWEQGQILVGGRQGLKKQWALSQHHLPMWADHEPWPPQKVVYQAAQKALRALGVATPAHIQNHFIRGCYPQLDTVLAQLEADGRITPVCIVEDGQAWPDSWYVHSDDLPRLAQLAGDAWQPRTTLLSPFDNLICDRTRTETLFDFTYRSEIYTPKSKRQYGYYVMPILHGEQLIGRIDPKMDRKRQHLLVNAVFIEPEASLTDETVASVAQAIEDLAHFLGADHVVYNQRLPAAFGSALRG